jgi:hypothetical protein
LQRVCDRDACGSGQCACARQRAGREAGSERGAAGKPFVGGIEHCERHERCYQRLQHQHKRRQRGQRTCCHVSRVRPSSTAASAGSAGYRKAAGTHRQRARRGQSAAALRP